jgi:hypothetical protein
MDNFNCSRRGVNKSLEPSCSTSTSKSAGKRETAITTDIHRKRRHVERDDNDTDDDDVDDENNGRGNEEIKSNLTCQNVKNYDRICNAMQLTGNNEYLGTSSRSYYSRSKRTMYENEAAPALSHPNFINQNEEDDEDNTRKIDECFGDENDDEEEHDSLNTITLSSSNSIVELSSQDNSEFYGENFKWSKLALEKNRSRNKNVENKIENMGSNALAEENNTNDNDSRHSFINLTDENDGEAEEEEITFSSETPRRPLMTDLDGRFIIFIAFYYLRENDTVITEFLGSILLPVCFMSFYCLCVPNLILYDFSGKKTNFSNLFHKCWHADFEEILLKKAISD